MPRWIELRPFIAGLDAAGLAPDRLAVLGKIRELAGAHGGGVKLVEQAKLDQLAHGMRQNIDADAKRLQRRDALEDFGGNADLMQAECQRQSADAAAGDKNGHDAPSLLRSRSWHGSGAVGNRESPFRGGRVDGGTVRR